MRWFAPILLVATFFANGQPLVHEEPFHVPIFQNKHLRILNVKTEVGDTTLFHVHQNDIAYVTLSGSRIWLQELETVGRTVNLPTDWLGSDLTHNEDPLIHRFANVGEYEFHLLAFEVLTDRFSKSEFKEVGEVLFEDERFNIQSTDMKTLVFDVPGAVIITTNSNELVGVTPIKPGKAIKMGPIEDSMKILIVQLK